MRAVIAIPELVASATGQSGWRELVMRRVAGIPLLKRTILTASRAGSTDTLLICVDAASYTLAREISHDMASSGIRVRSVYFSKFDPRDSSSWKKLEALVSDSFLWVPWNWVTSKRFLTNLPVQASSSADWAQPALISLRVAAGKGVTYYSPHPEGVTVNSLQDIPNAERFLVARSGKILDGIHTSFNRWLCRPFVRLLSYTSVSPNAVTFGGVVVSFLSAIAFARGGYWHSVLGAALFYLAGLFDEVDGMLARIKFAESPRGTWLEGLADGLSYVLLFIGITIGLCHRYGRPAMVMGILLLIGTLLSLTVTSLQRRLATTADRPNEYRDRMYELLESDAGNWISRFVRRVEAFIRRGIFICYVFILTVIGALPLIFLLATVGANLTWILTLYFNRRFFARSFYVGTRSPANNPKETL